MGSIQRDSLVKNVLKNLCCSYGWSYGVFWSFEQPHSVFLTVQDIYDEEKIIQDLHLQIPMLGGGIIGQAAFTKKHQWMFLDDPKRRQDSLDSIWDTFLDDSEFLCQFSSGIKTIAAIPVEPQGVVQFGSTHKVMETTEFVNQTKRMFKEIVNGNRVVEIRPCSSANSQICPPPSGLFPCLISSEDAYGINDSLVPTLPGPTPSCSFTSNSQPMSLDPNDLFPQFISDQLAPFNESMLSDSNAMDPHFLHRDLLDAVMGYFDISQWIPPSPVQTNHLLMQVHEPTPMNSEEKGECSTVSANTGDLGAIVMPVANESYNFRSYKSFTDGSTDPALDPRRGLLSKLGIERLLEGLHRNYNATSPTWFDDRVSSATKRRRTGDSIWEMSSLPPVACNGFEGKNEPGLWMANAYSMNCLSTVSQAKKDVEPPKVTKKAKPGTRPRPKDRQQILDRMSELRELIPNGDKMSIDCLLDRTIKHMLFLQSVTKHAERIKHADEPKDNNENDPSSNGATWAYELGNRTMVCPLIVKDLSIPGQMLIEMLCEEQGFFIEMVDIIRGFGLTILKGVMEVRDKIWASFIVEAEAKRDVTRHEIFSALVRLLQGMPLDDGEVHNKVIEATNHLLDHSQVQLPVSLAEMDYCINL